MAIHPEILAQHKALATGMDEIVERLHQLLGRRLVAQIGGAPDESALDFWRAGIGPGGEPEQRLRVAYQVAEYLSSSVRPSAIQAWFTECNPILGEESPVGLLQEGVPEAQTIAMITAARVFALTH
jgi:hypothetical protein